jgi:polyphosphate kinase
MDAPNMFHLIRSAGPILLQHPYESFATSVERFLREASRDPKVLAIKMTLYRTARKSKIIEYLIDAAENGKQVAVAVELKARFDEEANVRWANSLEEAGIHVSYGVLGLKTHAKVIFVLRRDYDGLRRYAHFGTGNYHAGTARLYSDLGLLTCDPVLGADMTELFNFLTTGYVAKPPLPQAAARADRTSSARCWTASSARSRGTAGGARPHPVQDQRTGGFPDHPRALYRASMAGRAGRPDRPRQLPAAAGRPGAVGQHPGDQHRRPVPRACAHLLLPQRRRPRSTSSARPTA